MPDVLFDSVARITAHAVLQTPQLIETVTRQGILHGAWDARDFIHFSGLSTAGRHALLPYREPVRAANDAVAALSTDLRRRNDRDLGEPYGAPDPFSEAEAMQFCFIRLPDRHIGSAGLRTPALPAPTAARIRRSMMLNEVARRLGGWVCDEDHALAALAAAVIGGKAGDVANAAQEVDPVSLGRTNQAIRLQEIALRAEQTTSFDDLRAVSAIRDADSELSRRALAHIAAYAGNLSALRSVATQIANHGECLWNKPGDAQHMLPSRDITPDSALVHSAVNSRDPATVRFVLDPPGVEVDFDPDDWDASRSATEINTIDSFHEKPIEIAIYNHDREIVRLIAASAAERGVLLDWNDEYVTIAVDAGDLDIVKLLAELDTTHAGQRAFADGSYTALQRAIMNDEPRILEYLLGLDREDIVNEVNVVPGIQDQSIDTIRQIGQDTPWTIAANWLDPVESTDVLSQLENDPRFDINEGNAGGETPLHIAAKSNTPFLKYLITLDVRRRKSNLQNGIDFFKTDARGETALRKAAISGNSEAVGLLADIIKKPLGDHTESS